MSIIISQIAEKIKGFRHQKRQGYLPAHIFEAFERGVQGEKLFSEKFFPLQILFVDVFMYRIDALHDSSEERVHVVAADIEIREDREDVGVFVEYDCGVVVGVCVPAVFVHCAGRADSCRIITVWLPCSIAFFIRLP